MCCVRTEQDKDALREFTHRVGWRRLVRFAVQSFEDAGRELRMGRVVPTIWEQAPFEHLWAGPVRGCPTDGLVLGARLVPSSAHLIHSCSLE